MMHEPKKSDPSTVAAKPANNPNGLGAVSVDRREVAEGNSRKDRMHRTLSRATMSSGLERVRERAKPRRQPCGFACTRSPRRLSDAALATQVNSEGGCTRAAVRDRGAGG